MDSVQEYIQRHKNYKLSDKPKWNEAKLDNEALHTNIQVRLKSNKRKPWTAPHGITVEEVDNAWEQLGESEKNRGKALRDHLNKQKDGLRRGYANLANEFYDFIVTFKKDISESGTKGEPQDQLAFLRGKESELESDQRPEQLKSSYQILEELGLADENPYTDLTLEELMLMVESVKNGLKKKKQAIQSQLAASGQSNITDDQIAEFQDTFKHFDKDRSGALDKLEFRACLQTLGQAYSDEAFNKLFAQLAGGNEKIDMDTFVKYMISLLEDTDSAIQIKQSFKILANERNNISSSDLQVPPLQNTEIEYLTTRMRGSGSDYDYNHYTDEVFA